jgi:glycosyltransferase involved in cell wall biosynthesis
MDLFGEMILDHLRRGHAGEVEPARVCPPYRRRLAGLPAVGGRGLARNVDRLANRFLDYPSHARRLARSGRFDLFHLVDHSYAQLVHELPAGRAVVTCHDLDTFRCLLEPAAEPRPGWFRAMARRILSGLQKAAAVACVSEATRDAILDRGLLPADRLSVVPTAVPPEFLPDPDPEADARADALLGPPGGDAGPDLLHVGTTIPRKRIDVLLRAFAGVRRAHPGARLLRAGGPLTAEQARLAGELGVADAVLTLPFLDRRTLAAVYRRADLALQPSDAEGFGLPLAEALACGTPALASAIPALREVGGEAVAYAPPGDAPAWTEAALDLLDRRRADPDAWRARREAGLARADRYRWTAHVDRLAAIYRDVLTR